MNPGTGKIPIVLAFAGHDPSGGAGLQADIEAVASQGCHAATVVTALTVQDTQDVSGYTPVDSTLVIAQARSILEDMPVAVFKIGMLGSIENAEAVHTILMDYPEIPVVFDPVLASGNGTDLGGEDLIEVLQALLLPVTTILTPNGPEARALALERFQEYFFSCCRFQFGFFLNTQTANANLQPRLAKNRRQRCDALQVPLVARVVLGNQ